MKIAQIAPLWESVPPPAYGGIELVVGLLTDELVRRGHDVTLFASGDSTTLAKLVSVHPQALRLDSEVKDCSVYEMLNLAAVYEKASEFDIIHSHVGCAALLYAQLVKTPTIHTLHGIFTPDNEKLFKHSCKQPFVSISHAQQEPRLDLNCVATVHNGIDPNRYTFHPEPDNPPYLAFLGRMSPEKGPHLAIEIAQRTGWKLKMAGKVDPVDQEFFETQVKPHCDGQQIEYLGEAKHEDKSVLLGGAVATLFPITWREPFGLVMVESMVVGTPVIAMNLGSVPEVIADGKTGYICNTVEECVAALDKISDLSRYYCHQYVVDKFSSTSMTNGYEAVYKQVMEEKYALNGHAHQVVMR